MFSSGKSIASIVIASLVDKDLLDYDQKVEHYWPDFGKNGKSDITLADVLRHESGLQDLNHSINPSDLTKKSIKSNVVSGIIESSNPLWPTKELGCCNPDGTETRRAYHALTRGWVLNEIVRRVDPQYRTIGEIIEHEIGIEGLRCGVTQEEIDQISDLKCKSQFWLLLQSMIPKGNLYSYLSIRNTP